MLDPSVNPSGFDDSTLLIYDRDTEGRQLGEIKRIKKPPCHILEDKQDTEP